MLGKTLFISILYLATMIALPLIAGSMDINFIKELNQPQLGVIHAPSLVFICFSYLLLIWGASSAPKAKIKDFFTQISDAEGFFSKSCQRMNTAGDCSELYRELDVQRQSSDLTARLLQLIYLGGSDKDVTRTLEIESSQYRQSSLAKIKNTGFAATLLPLLGMAGTITGLMFIFSGDLQAAGSAEESFNQKFAGMGIALLTTLYATIITSLLAKPSQHAQQHELSDALLDIERAENYVLLFKHSVNLSQWVMYSRNTAVQGDNATLNSEQSELRGAA